MHVLMLSALEVWALQGQGGAPSLYRTLQAYGDAGHRVTFISPTVGANAQVPQDGLRYAEQAPLPAFQNVDFVRFHMPSLQESRFSLPGPARAADQKLRFALLFPRLAARQAERALRTESFDLIYGYEVHGVLAGRLLRAHGRKQPLVARFQGTVLRPHLDSRIGLARRYEEVRAIRTEADLYIMTNDGTQGDVVLAKLNPASEGKVRFWRNGLDLERLRPATVTERAVQRDSLGMPADGFVLLTASRLAAWKRVDRAIAAMPRIVASVPNAQLVVVGDGEERTHLERQARHVGVASKVRFIGSVPQEDVAAYMRAADVVLAIADLSNVGNPLLEAMCCALPIVSVDAGDTRDLIRDRETGILLRAGIPNRIADAVIELDRDVDLRDKVGAGARSLAEAEFWTWDERMAAELEAVEALVAPAVPVSAL